MRIGVLALQGDFREHVRMLESLGVDAVAVRRPSELGGIDALILPGGESTTIAKLAVIFGLMQPIRDRIRDGMPAFGSCAGMILLADRILDAPADQESIGGIDMTVRRNAFGRQLDSFEEKIVVAGFGGEPMTAVFIRAPWVEQVGPGATVLATVSGGHGLANPAGNDGAGNDGAGNDAVAGRVVAVRQGQLLATSFHPELTGDTRMHVYFCDMVKEQRG